MLAVVASATLQGVEGHAVSVEVHVSDGLPGFSIVGLPDTSCREARDRVRAALLSSGLSWPTRKTTVNLAPSGVPKVGAGLDLAIALALAAADEQIDPGCLHDLTALGELGLDGSIRPVLGAMPLVAATSASRVLVPLANLDEARLVGEGRVVGVGTLRQTIDALTGEGPWPHQPDPTPRRPVIAGPDLAEVRGQRVARFALEVAAAGGHHVLFVGPPGAGKTMLARRLPGLLPPLDAEQALEVTRVHSAAGAMASDAGLIDRPPFRAPHHGASAQALVGGGSAIMRPGELSLAHHGVLFLDELGEFAPIVLDTLRQPLEEGVVRVARLAACVTYPARVLLVGAMNPCPCGGRGSPGGCRCSDAARARYHRRVSGPLLDRFDLRVVVPRPSPDDLLAAPPGEPSAAVADRVAAARRRALERGVPTNSRLGPAQLERHAALDGQGRGLLRAAVAEGRLSARGLARVRSVARTIADLDGRDDVTAADLRLALSLRVEAAAFDRQLALQPVPAGEAAS